MALYTSGVPSALLPEQIEDLLVEPVTQTALAFEPAVATTIRTASAKVVVPVVREDAGASWIAEGAEISPDDAVFDEIEIVPSKVAGLSVISRELAEDSSPEAAQLIGDGLARSIAQQVDKALFAEPVLAAPAPAGLGSVTPIVIPVTEPIDSLDYFAAAVSNAEQLGVSVTAWVANPTEALSLATLKADDTGRTPLLSVDPAQGARRTIEGRPLLVSQHVQAGTIWGLPASRVAVVLREGATIDVSDAPFFTSDRVALKATLRVGFAVLTPDAVARLEVTAGA